MPKKATKTPNRPAAGKRYPLNMRTTVETRRALEAAALRSGRSLAQEVETRLENSFSSQATLDAALGPPELRGLVLDVLVKFLNAHHEHAKTDPKWFRDGALVYGPVSSAIGALLEYLPDDHTRLAALMGNTPPSLIKAKFDDGETQK